MLRPRPPHGTDERASEVHDCCIKLTNDFACYRNLPTAGGEKTPIAKEIASRVVTLPLYAELAFDDVKRICEIILG